MSDIVDAAERVADRDRTDVIEALRVVVAEALRRVREARDARARR